MFKATPSLTSNCMQRSVQHVTIEEMLKEGQWMDIKEEILYLTKRSSELVV